MIPNVYRIDWELKRPAGSPSVVRLFVAPVVGARVRIPLQSGLTRSFQVLKVEPIALLIGVVVKADEYAADLVLLNVEDGQ